jgi:pyridoxal phosphate enzyme (YggS family)
MIAEQLQQIKSSLPEKVTLVAVSKTKPVEDLLEAYNAGQRILGENKVQEMCDKHDALPKDIEWHLIGHLQTNKVKYITPFVALIHGVDSLKLLLEINKQGAKIQRVIPVLLQFYIAKEETKFGLSIEEATEIMELKDTLTYCSIQGLMGMASFTDNEEQVKAEFAQLKSHFDLLKSTYFKKDALFSIVSMGMSGDYSLAIEEGSTMVRIGSSIFGSR